MTYSQARTLYEELAGLYYARRPERCTQIHRLTDLNDRAEGEDITFAFETQLIAYAVAHSGNGSRHYKVLVGPGPGFQHGDWSYVTDAVRRLTDAPDAYGLESFEGKIEIPEGKLMEVR